MMGGRLKKALWLLLFVFGVMYVVCGVELKQGRLIGDNWIQYVLVGLFFALLLQFWALAERVHRQEILKASITDGFSMLFNSSHFFKMLEAEIERSRRRNHPLSAVYLDVDYFQRYNQVHGLKAGNRVLAYAGQLIKDSTRSYDSGFRFGNDEFALIFPETDRSQARVVAERLRERFFNQFGGELGFSIGIAELDGEDNVDRMVRKAEAAMQEARRNGGNRTRAYVERGQL